MTWRDISSWSGGTAMAGATGEIVSLARLTALLLAGLLRHASLNQILFFSHVITKPPTPPPAVADDAGWQLMPHDDLDWIASIGNGIDLETRTRAQREIGRRVRDGRKHELKFNPPALPDHPDDETPS